MNVRWNKVNAEDHLSQRTRGWFEGNTNIRSAYFKDHLKGIPVKSASQAGGVSAWSLGQGSHRHQTHGQDALGRWVWVQYEGRDNISLRVVTAYRPVRNKDDAGLVWSQQQSYLLQQGYESTICPLKVYDNDLAKMIKDWIEDGEQVVLGIDANEDLR